MAERLVVLRVAPAKWLNWSGFLGGGTAALDAVAAVWPRAQAVLAEPTEALCLRSRDLMRGPWWTGRRLRAQVLHESEVPADGVAMLWANMALHLSDAPQRTLAQWLRALASDGILMFSTFGPDTLRELSELYRAAGWPPAQPRYVDMHDIGDALVGAGFADPVMDQETLTLHWSSAEALLAELRALGQNLAPRRFAGLRTPRWRQRLAAALQARAGADGRIALRFEIVYGHAIKPAPRPAGDATTTHIALDTVRASLRRGVHPGRPQDGVE